MNVLHVHSGNLFGGVETVLLSLASVSVEESGLRHEFALCFDGEFGRRVRPMATVHSLGPVQVRRPWTIRRARRRLNELLAEGGYDVVVVHSAWAQAVFGATARGAGALQVYWVHDALDGRHWIQRWARRTEPDYLLCSSQFVAGTIPRLYADREWALLYYPLRHTPDTDASARRTVRSELEVPEDEVVIVQVGRMEPYKGHALLLEALREVRDLPGWRVWEVGGAQRPAEQRYVRELERLATKFGIEGRIRFLGQRGDVSRLLAGADIFCQPNLGPEPFGLTFVEAMHAGLPVVTMRFGGAVEALGECGWLVEPGNVQELARTLRHLITDPDLRRRGGAGRERARSLTDPIQQSEKLSSILREFLAKRGSP